MKGLPKIVMSLAMLIVLGLMVYIIMAVLSKPQYGMTYVVSPVVEDWRPPVGNCPDDVELWECVRSALYAKEDTSGTP